MASPEEKKVIAKVRAIHRALDACRACPNMVGPVVHGPAMPSKILLVGQAPGPHEGKIGRPFAWTAGKTLFRWFEESLGLNEAAFREHIYMTAVARCFPGKAKGGGDRVPDREEIARCGTFVAQETRALSPSLVIPVGKLAIEQVFGESKKLTEVVGQRSRRVFHGVETDVICLPHPSGASTWHRMEPGVGLLKQALALLGEHPEVRRILAAQPPI